MMKVKISLIAGSLLLIVLSFGCKGKISNPPDNSENVMDAVYLMNKGKQITMASFRSLSSELQNAMKNGGINNALKYCNSNAISITDSLSNEYNTTIRRTSLKVRNSQNTPTEEEKKVLMKFEETKRKGDALSAKIVSGDISKTFYAPIIMSEMCLKCHGEQSNISNYDVIKSLYPNDMAYGYKAGDLRGMWSVTFRNDN